MANFVEIRTQAALPGVGGKAVGTFYANLLDSLYDGVYFVDSERKITYWNKGAEHLSGFMADEVVGKYCFDNLLDHVTSAGCQLCFSGCPLHQTLEDGERRESEVYLRHKNGQRVPVSVRVSPIVAEDGTIVGAVEVFSDISTMKKLERKAGELENLAYCDALTNVANRRFLELTIERLLHENRGRHGAGLILVDLDEFKVVNDRYGHGVGDQVLRAISDTLAAAIRPGDTVGRWGGDEFLLVMADVTKASLEHLAERCRRLVGQTSVETGDGPIQLTASVGATMLLTKDSCETAVERADLMLYVGKAAGRNSAHIG